MRRERNEMKQEGKNQQGKPEQQGKTGPCWRAGFQTFSRNPISTIFYMKAQQRGC